MLLHFQKLCLNLYGKLHIYSLIFQYSLFILLLHLQLAINLYFNIFTFYLVDFFLKENNLSELATILDEIKTHCGTDAYLENKELIAKLEQQLINATSQSESNIKILVC